MSPVKCCDFGGPELVSTFSISLQSCSKRKRSAVVNQLTSTDDRVFSTSKMLHILPGANSATTTIGTGVVCIFVKLE